MDYKEIKESYQKIIDERSETRKSLNQRIFQVGTLRLILVIATLIACYIFWHNTTTVVVLVTISAIIFLTLIKYHNRLFKRRLYCNIQIKNAKNEIKGLNYDFSPFDGAAEYINGEHSFSMDLDFFGDRSFFQSVNRTVTSFGKEKLADNLLYPSGNKDEVYVRQEAIKELSSNPGLLAYFRAIGDMTEKDDFNIQNFAEGFPEKYFFKGNRFWKLMLVVFPALYVLWIVLWFTQLISSDSFMLLWILTLALSSVPSKKVKIILAIFDKKTKALDTYSQLLKIIENEKFDSSLLKEIQHNLKGDIPASQAIAKLKSLNNNLEMSFAFPVMLIFNPVLLWNVRYALKIEEWLDIHKQAVVKWFDNLGIFDSIVSQSVFAYNHPDYTYPQVSENFVFEAKELGHPLIDRDKCVRNDVHIIKKPYFLVITGANMAGKSTYLRTIGINLILARAGMPVCAEKLTFYPFNLVTNLRTADSLADNESYFFAELKKLKSIIERLQNNEELFIILDEILKGTNSEDKQKGSLALMRQLISLGGTGIIATHDLVLGNLEKEFPDIVKDYCFEAEIINDHLYFSYKIKEGIARNMNACFLMKQMGITGL